MTCGGTQLPPLRGVKGLWTLMDVPMPIWSGYGTIQIRPLASVRGGSPFLGVGMVDSHGSHFTEYVAVRFPFTVIFNNGMDMVFTHVI